MLFSTLNLTLFSLLIIQVPKIEINIKLRYVIYNLDYLIWSKVNMGTNEG